MKKPVQVLIAAACAAMVFLSWYVTLSSRTDAQKQLSLIREAEALISNEIYILAVPLLEEASNYDAKHTAQAEEMLKTVYLSLGHNRGFARMYTTLLEKQMNRPDAPATVFAEAANYQLKQNATQNAIVILKQGIIKTGDEGLTALYESIRYTFETTRTSFSSVMPIFNQTLQVERNGKWGIANTSGTLIIPCRYDKVSTFYKDRAIVKMNNLIYAVDRNNNRLALASSNATDFRNYADYRTALLLPDGWHRATGELISGTSIFEDIGMYSGGYAAAKTGGKWGVVDISNDWLIPAQYDAIIQDELGRCYGQGSVFVRSSDEVFLYSDGDLLPTSYQDARPFSGTGYAAVMQGGKWGFIDTEGNAVIDFIYDDALSFNGHLAAVKVGDCWGYISISGILVIDAVFLDAKSFSGGSAPVLTEKGWQIITLIEYKKEEKLL